MKSSSALPIAIAIAFILATVTASCSCGTQATITVPATTSFPTTFEITAADNYTCRSSKGIGYYASGILYAGYSSTGSLTGDDYLAVTSFTPSNYAPSTATNVNACSNNIWTTNTSTSSTSVGYTIVCNNKYEDCDICTSYTPFCSRLPPSTSCCYDNHGANDLNSDYVKCTDGTTSGFSVVGSTWYTFAGNPISNCASSTGTTTVTTTPSSTTSTPYSTTSTPYSTTSTPSSTTATPVSVGTSSDGSITRLGSQIAGLAMVGAAFAI